MELNICHLYPDILNLYGDRGNIITMKRRLEGRGIKVNIDECSIGQPLNADKYDIFFIGGGQDFEQEVLLRDLSSGKAQDIRTAVEEEKTFLAICGGYQILGHEWLLGDEVVQGLGIVDMTTERAAGGSGDRLIDNIVLTSPLAKRPVVGYENHAGRTHLGAGVEPFGAVASSTGHGNNDADKQDGVRYKNVVGTYLHGPLLAKNPEVADDLLARALQRFASRTGQPAIELAPLDDAVEQDANDAMVKKLGVHR